MKEKTARHCTNQPSSERSCYFCANYSALVRPKECHDGSVIHGYCFKGGNGEYIPNMGKGLAVYIPGSACKGFKKKPDNVKHEPADTLPPSKTSQDTLPARWVQSDFIDGMLSCSKCGAQRNPKFKIGLGAWNFCPNCGAPMAEDGNSHAERR